MLQREREREKIEAKPLIARQLDQNVAVRERSDVYCNPPIPDRILARCSVVNEIVDHRNDVTGNG